MLRFHLHRSFCLGMQQKPVEVGGRNRQGTRSSVVLVLMNKTKTKRMPNCTNIDRCSSRYVLNVLKHYFLFRKCSTFAAFQFSSIIVVVILVVVVVIVLVVWVVGLHTQVFMLLLCPFRTRTYP